jgi:hypothetical protein
MFFKGGHVIIFNIIKGNDLFLKHKVCEGGHGLKFRWSHPTLENVDTDLKIYFNII